MLRKNGLEVSVKPCATLQASRLDRCLLAMSNVWRRTIFEAVAALPSIFALIPISIFTSMFTLRSPEITTNHASVLRDKGLYVKKSNPGTSSNNSGSQSSQTQGSSSSSQTQTSPSSRPAQQHSHRPSPQNSQIPTSTLGAQPSLVNISQDFVLLCLRVGTYLTKRHDISVSGVTRDRELFVAFRLQYYAHSRYLRWAPGKGRHTKPEIEAL